jgi:hypothetical protein
VSTEVQQRKSRRPFWVGVLVGAFAILLAVGSGVYLGRGQGQQGTQGVAGPAGPAGPKGDSALTSTGSPSGSPSQSGSPSVSPSVAPSGSPSPSAPVSEVTITSCQVGPSGYPTARLTITNTDSVPHNYTIKVKFPPLVENTAAPAQTEVQVNALQPGASTDETTTWETTPKAAFKCVVAPSDILRV